MKVSALGAAIEAIEAAISDIETAVENYKEDTYNFVESYDELLNEMSEDEIKVGGLVLACSPAELLKEHDPTAYRCGLIDYIDSIDIEDDPNYKKYAEPLQDRIEELKDILEQLREIEEGVEDEL